MWRRAARPQGVIRRRDHRRRLARPRDRVLPAEGARDPRRRDPRGAVHRVGRGGAQHDDPAFELQDARGRALLRREREAVRGPVAGAELQPAVLAVRPPDARALRPGDVRDGQPRRGQPPAGDRLAPDLPRRDQAARAGDAGRQPRHDLSGAGCPVSPAGRDHPPRRGRLGARARRRSRRRRDPPEHRGHGADAVKRAGHRGSDQPRHDQGRPGAQLHRRLDAR